jgi:hypothetical protein
MFGLDLVSTCISNRGRLVFTVVALLSEVSDLIAFSFSLLVVDERVSIVIRPA